VKRFKQLLFRKRPEAMEGILGSGSRIVQPPLQIRPSVKRKAKSQDTDNRRPIEGALTTEGVHHVIKIDDNDRRVPRIIDDLVSKDPAKYVPFAAQSASTDVLSADAIVSEPDPIAEAKVVHESSSYRPPMSQPIPIHAFSNSSTPTTPIGKGHAHDPLEDHLYLNIGTGEDFPPQDDNMIVSESPSNVDIDVYETAYQEEVQRILKQKEGQEVQEGQEPPRRPTLYLTRRVEYVKSIRENDSIFDAGRAVGKEVKGDLKTLAKKAIKNVDNRGELQKLEGKDSKLSRGLKSILEFKDLVDEAREIVREEERKERSRSSTPIPKLSRSNTPVAVEK
jgi:[calcium/calmodulin-dependent protein kinase] kinase